MVAKSIVVPDICVCYIGWRYKTIDEMKISMRHYWQAGKKVEALKITIRAAKMMETHRFINEDISNYPMHFMHIATLLDEFGELVYSHIILSLSRMEPVLEPVLEPSLVHSEEDWGVVHHNDNKQNHMSVIGRRRQQQQIMEYRAGEKTLNEKKNVIIYPRRAQVGYYLGYYLSGRKALSFV